MHNHQDDILLIKKYLNGELDARAMHELERRAQDDPFLMDALEGYEAAGGIQSGDIADLAGRLKNRTGRRGARVISMRLVGIAASILTICSAGGWWLYQNSQAVRSLAVSRADSVLVRQAPPVAAQQAKTDTTAKPNTPAPAVSINEGKLAHVSTPHASKTNFAGASPHTVADESVKTAQSQPVVPGTLKEVSPADTMPVDEMIAMQYSAKKKPDSTISVRRIAKVHPVIKAPAQQLQGQVPGVNIYSSGQSPADQNSILDQGYVQLPNAQVSMVIEGRVIAKDDGRPIAGASVNVEGTDKTTQTDGEGRFSIRADSIHANLVVAGIGYATRMVSANTRDSVKNIMLDPKSSALAEVVVTNNDSKNNADTTLAGDTVKAHPLEGWMIYKAYLKQSAVSPDGKKGTVKLTFTVDQSGNIGAIAVAKSVSDAADKKAIALVKNGPHWAGRSDKKPQEVRLRVRFVKSP